MNNIPSDLVLKRISECYVVGGKRQKAPYKIQWHCPKCGQVNFTDLTDYSGNTANG